MKTLYTALLLTSLLSSISANAGVFTYMAASDAAGAARDAATGIKNANKGVTVTGRSVMCSYRAGYCIVDNNTPMWTNAVRFNPTVCIGISCLLTPTAFVASYTGIKYNITSITYTYVDGPVAIINY